MPRWKFTHQVYYIVISSHFFSRKYIFVDQVSCFDIKFLIFVWNTNFFSCLHNFVKGIKNICQVYSFINQEGLVMTRLKELRRSGNYVLWNSTWPRLWISSQCGGICWNYFVVVQPKRHMFRITRWRSSGVPIEKIRTIWPNFARYVSMPNGNMSSPRGNQTWRWAVYERCKAVVSAGFLDILSLSDEHSSVLYFHWLDTMVQCTNNTILPSDAIENSANHKTGRPFYIWWFYIQPSHHVPCIHVCHTCCVGHWYTTVKCKALE